MAKKPRFALPAAVLLPKKPKENPQLMGIFLLPKFGINDKIRNILYHENVIYL